MPSPSLVHLGATVPSFQPNTYFIQTWGCQMNEEDSEQLALGLESIGFRPASSLREAQVILLNTCSVRRKPEEKAFSLLGELAPLKRANPDRVIGVCGCMAQARAEEIRRRAPHVDFVLGTGHVDEAPALVEQVLQDRRFATSLALPERKGAIVTDLPGRFLDRKPKLKAFVPIQYGCDKFCTFCIVPITRGRERSRPTRDILEEVRRLAEAGTREVTLLGQTVNSYGKNLEEGRVPFSELLWRIAEVPGIDRIRFTSPYPTDFKEDLIATIRDCPKVMEHVHLPLQSGDDQVLKAMRRLYTVERFREIVGQLRAAVPTIGITTDLIVGFPGETEEQFEGTLRVVEELQFDGAFMFLYSPRPGTKAADKEQVPIQVRRRRIRELVSLQNEISVRKNEAAVGRVFEVLVEGPSPKNPSMLQGFSRENKMVHFQGEGSLTGAIVQVEATRGHLWGVAGRLASVAKDRVTCPA
ncbi:MAG: tRNA (N6-isopentenyl adenosine(37)-C2)-methylthiotransferase MiaB [Fimbriimonadales bacterium]|nr:tRNA (N6-isopentenyl adenosine(37)-C2)-methylthiotransferase MiaB [Fimbriimonadales bacterium]